MEKQKSKDISDILFGHFIPRGLGACLLFGALAWLVTWAVSAACGLAAPTLRAFGIAQLAFVTAVCVGVFRAEALLSANDSGTGAGGGLRFLWCLLTPILLFALLTAPDVFGLPGSASMTVSSSDGDVGYGILNLGSNLWTDYPIKMATLFGFFLAALWFACAVTVWTAVRLWRLTRWAASSVWNVREE